MALKVQLDYLEVLVESPDFNGIESTMEEDIYSYRLIWYSVGDN